VQFDESEKPFFREPSDEIGGGGSSGNVNVNNWVTEWSNNGNGKISGWVINSNDVIFNYGYNFHFVNPNGWYANYLWYFGGWILQYNNGGNYYIGGWHIGSKDKYQTISGLIFVANHITKWAAVISQRYYAGYQQFITIWNNSGNGTVNGWQIGREDVYLTFKDNYYVLCVNPKTGWSALLNFDINNNNFYTLWNNNGDGTLGGWRLNLDDKLLSGKFIGNSNNPQILITNARTGWAAILEFNGGSWITLWSNGGNMYIGGWHLGAEDKIVANDFNSDGKDEILIANAVTGYASILNFNETPNSIWSNNGNMYIGGWHLGIEDKFIPIPFGYILCINYRTGYAAVLKFQ
jgi:hypothetical protein